MHLKPNSLVIRGFITLKNTVVRKAPGEVQKAAGRKGAEETPEWVSSHVDSLHHHVFKKNIVNQLAAPILNQKHNIYIYFFDR